jgi:tetratricopeptide (TPR) repeat protein
VPYQVAPFFVCALLVGLVVSVFLQTRDFSFVNFDDSSYVYGNASVRAGLSAEGLRWAFTHVVMSNWHPLTMLMHMLNCSLFGIQPAGHHLVNVALHALTAILLFLLLKSAFAPLWPSAWVSAVFAIHPLRVESVAWISELKDVLMAFFFVLTVWAYFSYARRPFSAWRYALVAVFFAAGLLCKPMLVTVPFLLVVLNFWPLKQFPEGVSSRAAVRRLSLELLPLLGLAAAVCLVTLRSQEKTINSVSSLSLPLRIENALWYYAIYLGQTLVPARLSVFYPLPNTAHPAWQTVLLLTLLVSVTALAWDCRRQRPWVIAGWLWFFGMLVPVIGLVQVGEQAHADRYTYLPQVGLLLVIATSAGTIWRRLPRVRQVCVCCLAASSVAFLAILAWAQTQHWRDSEALWTHALNCDPDNALAQQQLAVAFRIEGKTSEAIFHSRRALELKPSAIAQNNLAVCFDLAGDMREAGRHYRLAHMWDPELPLVCRNWGILLVREGDYAGAVRLFRETLTLEPGDADAHSHLAHALGLQNKLDEALVEFRRTLALSPGHISALEGLRETLRLLGKPEETIPFLERARAASGENQPLVICMMAEVFAQVGKRQLAVLTANEALDAANTTRNPALVSLVRTRVVACLNTQR